MTSRTRRAVLTAAGALAGVVASASLAAPAPAGAAPQATPDVLAMYAGGTYRVDPVANDRSVFSLPPTSGPLTLCGLGAVDGRRLFVEQTGNTLVVEVADDFQGTTRFSYEVCQGGQRAPGTVTIGVTRLQDVRAVKPPGTRRTVVFRNRNAVPVTVLYGRVSSARADATITVPAGRSTTITTSRRAIYWLGVYSDRGVLVVVGDGTVQRLRARS